MKTTRGFIFRSFLFLVATLFFVSGFRANAQSSNPPASNAAQATPVPARITQAIDETQLVPLKGNVHPLALPQFDQGAVPDATPMKRMMLVLQRSPDQETALRQLMDEQLRKDSPSFHHWLTPQQFGQQFGPADADVQAITSWLTQHGFQQIKVANGRTAIEFSGSAAQVRTAFHTEIHRFNVNGEVHQANASDPQIPSALAPVVAGILSLHNFKRKSQKRDAGIHGGTWENHGTPQFTTTSGCGANNLQPCYVVGPADFAKIYNIPAGLDGTNQQIAIVADSNINPQDVAAFRTLFGLSNNPPNIILDGPDPGLNGDEGEADLDVQVSGMVAPNATVDLVVSEDTLTALGVDLSAFYIIDNNIAPVMNESFDECEAALGAAGNQFFLGMWEEAAAQGISVFISAGDGASAGCDNFNSESSASLGLAVGGFASTPFNVAVGGTDFDDVGTQTTFWGTTNASGTRESALGYIHETTWNDSCAATATSSTLNTACSTPNNIVGGSGGPSSVYAKPAWQSGIIPNGIAAGDNHRYVPDVSLFASNGPQSNSFYLVCEADAIPAGSPPSCATSGTFSFEGVGGTSASSPAFAAIMALINQNNGRQGNPNPTLYKIAATSGQSCNSSTELLTGSTCAFNDITKGNNSVPCAGTSPNCSSTVAGTTGVLVSAASPTTPAWTTAAGYDLATGLGSVNVANLNTEWPIAVGTFNPTTTALTINGGTSTVTITHGASVTAKATVTSTSAGTPTGDVALLASTSVNGGIAAGTLPSGSNNVSIPTTFLPGGSYNVTARYAGDDTFGASTSNGVPVVVNKENSRLQYELVTLDPASGAIINPNATAVTYGSYFLRIDILNSTTNACQTLTGGTTTGCAFDATGTVTLTDNGSPLDGGTFGVNSAGHAEDQFSDLTVGAHTLSGTYSGDISYNAVTTAVTDSVTVTPAATANALSAANSVLANQATTLSVAIATQSISTQGPTGNVTFKDGSTTIGTVAAVPAGATATTFAGATATLSASFSTLGTHSLTAVYAGDTNYSTSTSTAVNVTVNSPGSFTLSSTALTLSSSTGASASSTITVTPSGGFTGNVVVTATAATLPSGVTCPNSPLTINVASASPATSMLNCQVTPSSSGLSAAIITSTPTYETKATPLTSPARGKNGGKGWWALSAGTGFAALFLFFLPGGRKRLHAALGLGLVCILSFTLGCGGGYGGGGGGGPVATQTAMTVIADKEPSGTPFTFNVTVTGGTPAGMAQLYDGANAISTAGASAAVSGGKASLTWNTSAAAVGTHAISVHYLGDAYTKASQSGSLNLTVTGSTTIAITTNPAATPAASPITVTVN